MPQNENPTPGANRDGAVIIPFVKRDVKSPNTTKKLAQRQPRRKRRYPLRILNWPLPGSLPDGTELRYAIYRGQLVCIRLNSLRRRKIRRARKRRFSKRRAWELRQRRVRERAAKAEQS
jgi:hypothetical protein